jgi:hypothetical protein
MERSELNKPKNKSSKSIAKNADGSKGELGAKPEGKWVASLPAAPDKEKAKAFADLALNPNVSAASVSELYLKATFSEQHLGSLVESLTDATAKVKGGDLSGCEAMLYGQAQALQDVFVTLARRAANQTQLTQWDAALRMALRAQNQCRMTLETLATIKNPPMIFAKQANFAAGHQQVNNGLHATSDSSRAGNSVIEQDKLLEAVHGKRLDTGTPGTAGGPNQELETLGALDRAAHN